MKGFNNGDINKVLMVRDLGRIHSERFKLDKFIFNKSTGKIYFSIVNEWNRVGCHNVT